MHRPDHAPSIPLDRLPEAEREAARALERSLAALPKYCEDFTAALTLFDYSEMGRAVGLNQTQAIVAATPPWSEVWLSTRWRLIAARDAAHTLAGFVRELEAIGRALAACPTLSAMIGEQDLPAPNDAANWPGVVQMKAIEEPGREARSAASPDPAAPVLEEPALYNRSFTTAVGGSRLTYALSAETEARMGDIRTRLWSAFAALRDGSGPR